VLVEPKLAETQGEIDRREQAIEELLAE